jgi:hypothetical protein
MYHPSIFLSEVSIFSALPGWEHRVPFLPWEKKNWISHLWFRELPRTSDVHGVPMSQRLAVVNPGPRVNPRQELGNIDQVKFPGNPFD